MSRRIKKLFLFIFIAALLVIPSAAFADNGVNVSLQVGRAEINVGDVIPLTVTVQHPKGWRVIFPTLDKKWGELEVRAQNAAQISENADGSETTTQEIDVTLFRPEQVTTPEMKLNVVDAQGQVQELNVEPAMLNVKSVLQENDTTLRDIKPQAELWQLSSSPLPLIASLALAFTIVGSAGYVVWKHRPFVDKRTPRERALDELKILDAGKVSESDAKVFCVRVSDTLRDYLQNGCGINAHDLTTGELAQVLREKQVSPEIASQIIHVLRVTDAAKFANDISDMETIQTLSRITQQVVLVYPPQTMETKSNRRGKK